jgi:hypothetical protein
VGSVDKPLPAVDACFVMRNHSGQKLAYVYFEDEPGRMSNRTLGIVLAQSGHPSRAEQCPLLGIADIAISERHVCF